MKIEDKIKDVSIIENVDNSIIIEYVMLASVNLIPFIICDRYFNNNETDSYNVSKIYSDALIYYYKKKYNDDNIVNNKIEKNYKFYMD